MNKKLLSLVLALVMVFSVFTTLFAEEETTEATETAPVTEEYIEFLKEHKLIIGDAKGDLMLDKEIDRASFATLLVRADDKEATAVAVKSLGSRFKDMTPAHWANGYANVASEQGWMKGNEKGEFMPSKTISYAEIATTLVRFLGTDDAGYVYPASYIAKAFELGLFEGVREITDYAQPAIRKDIFRMIYNAISKEDFGKYTVYKMIVLENNRTAQLASNEIKTEVLSVVQMPNKVSERGVGKIGEQFVFNLEGLKLDPEFMLGKVANFSVDEKGNLVKVVVDESYDYVWGGFVANEKNFTIGGRKYGVRIDERYWNNTLRDKDDRMYRTYVTSGYRADNYHYEDFQKAIENEKISPNFARITAKDGMVIFIDTFELKDIAPVKEVARDGKDVYYYNDARDGVVERMTPATRVIGYTEKEGFHVMSAKDIKANDVIHWMSGFTLVRRDAEVADKLEKTFLDRDGEWAVIGEKAYYLNSKTNRKHPFVSVYAYDNTNFRALGHRGQIDDMKGDDVLALLDIRNGIQLITSHKKFTEAVALVNKVVSSHGIEYWAPNKEDNYRLADNYEAFYIPWGVGDTRTKQLNEFNLRDLVFVQSYDEDQIGITATIRPYHTGDDKGYDDLMKGAKFEEKYARHLEVGGKIFRYDADTKVFAYATKDGKFDGLIKTDMETVIKYNHDKTFDAFVVTEKEYKDFLEGMRIPTYNRFSERTDKAKIVIFRNITTPDYSLAGAEYGRVVRIENYANRVTIETSDRTYEDFIVLKGSIDFRKVDLGSFVQFRRQKDAETGKEAARFLKVLDMGKCYEIESKTYHSIKLKGVKDAIQIDQYTKEYGDSRNNFVHIYKFIESSEYAEIVVFVEECGTEEPTKLTEAQKAQVLAFETMVNKIDPAATSFETDVKAARAYYNDNMDEAAQKAAEEANKKLKAYEASLDPTAAQREAFINTAKKVKDVVSGTTTYEEAKDILEKYKTALAEFNKLTAADQSDTDVAAEKTRIDTAKSDAQAIVDEHDLAENREKLMAAAKAALTEAAAIKAKVEADYNDLTTEQKANAEVKAKYDAIINSGGEYDKAKTAAEKYDEKTKVDALDAAQVKAGDKEVKDAMNSLIIAQSAFDKAVELVKK